MTKPHQATLGALLRQGGGSIKTGPFGTALKASEYSEAGVPVVSVGEIGNGRLRITSRTPKVGPGVVRRLSEYVLQANDIVFGRKGAVDRSAIISDSEDGYFLGSDGIRIRLGTAVDSLYMSYLLQSDKVRDWLVQNATGTTIASLNQEILSRVPVSIPPLAQQYAVGRALADVDASITMLARMIVKKQAIKQGLMQQLLTGKSAIRGSMASGSEAPLSAITSWMSGGTPDRNNPAYWGGTIPWISAATLKNSRVYDSDQHLTEAGVRASSKPAPADATLVLVRGMALHRETRIGMAVRTVSFNQDVKALIPKPGILPEYLVYALQARSPQILDLVSSAGSGTGVLNTQLLQRLPIWVPDEITQRRIVEVVDTADRHVEALDRLVAKKQAIKQGMMQQLLTDRSCLSVKDGGHE